MRLCVQHDEGESAAPTKGYGDAKYDEMAKVGRTSYISAARDPHDHIKKHRGETMPCSLLLLIVCQP